MRRSVHFIGCVILLDIIYCTPSSMRWLTAVTSSLTMSQFFHTTRTNIRQLSFEPRRTTEEDSVLKNTICHFIGGSGYFLMDGYKTVNMPSILLQNETIDVYNTHTRETVKEDVFPCIVVARSEDDTTAFKFYISHEYDVSDSALGLEMGYSVGRFIFVYENDRFYCDALAEESALTYGRPEHDDVEELYLVARGNHEIADGPLTDPLCSLDFDKKLRICAIVMNSSHFSSKVRFLPNSRKVEPECEIRQVREIEGATSEIRSQEWMMVCVVEELQTDIEIKYYISRAYAHAQVFVYSVLNEDSRVMVLENLNTQVRLIIDDGNRLSISHDTPPTCSIA